MSWSQFAKFGGTSASDPSVFGMVLMCVDGRSKDRFRSWFGVGTRCRKCTVGLIRSMCSRMSSGTEYEWQPVSTKKHDALAWRSLA